MGWDRDDADVSTTEGLYFLDFLGETAVVNVFHVSRELEDGDFLDDSDVEQSIIRDSVGHGHHASTVETAIANGEVENIVVEGNFVVDKELDMSDFICQYALDQTNQIANRTAFSFLFHEVG